MKLTVFAQGSEVGTLDHDRERQQWSFEYSAAWLARENRYALSPSLPLGRPPTLTAEQHSLAVRTFFENLLPEGQPLDDAAAALKVSKAESFGLLSSLGRETAGALEILPDAPNRDAKPVLRPIPRAQLSERIRARPHEPFTVWDGRVRLSIAGYQDKLAIYEDAQSQWYLVEGPTIASTHLLKPDPVRAAMAGMTTNERLCMQLASAVGVTAAATRWELIPEPVLIIERFDRVRQPKTIERLHCIDGAQALGIPVSMKYERPYGKEDAVKDIRDGASLPAFFNLVRVHSPSPAADMLRLLRWVILQVLIGNTDTHAKNLSFFVGTAGLQLAPAYDLVCGLVYKDIDDDLAMAIGDEFAPHKLSAFDWAQFAHDCCVPPRLVAREIGSLCQRTLEALPAIQQSCTAEGGHRPTIARVSDTVMAQARRLAQLAGEIPKVPSKLLS